MDTREQKISKLKKRKREAELLLDLEDHAGVKKLLQELTQRVEGIESKLLYTVGMTKEERDLLFVERDCWNWLKSQFDSAKTTLKNTTNTLSKYE